MAEQPVYPSWDGYLESSRPRPTPINGGKKPKKQTWPHKHDGDLDSYDLSDPTYDADAWYVATAGASKQSRSVHLKIPEPIAEVLEQFVQSNEFPQVRTSQDFIRSSIVHEIYRRISEIRDPNFVVPDTAFTEMHRIAQMMTEFETKKNFVITSREHLEEAEGCPREIARTIEMVNAAIETGRYEGPLLEELERLMERYGRHSPRLVDVTDLNEFRLNTSTDINGNGANGNGANGNGANGNGANGNGHH
jgi:hypothetical protein